MLYAYRRYVNRKYVLYISFFSLFLPEFGPYNRCNMAASWQQWVDLVLYETKPDTNNIVPCASHAVIMGKDGTFWASTKDFKIPSDFCENVHWLFENKGPSEDISKLEVEIDGRSEYYIVLQVDPGDSIIAKKGTCGLTVADGKQFYVVGVYEEGTSHGNNKKRVLAVRDELNNNF